MPPKHQTLKLHQLFSSSKPSKPIPPPPKSLKPPLSAASPPPESPDIPNWLANNETPNKNDDDFIIPSLADWVQSHSIGNVNSVAIPPPIEPEISAADKLSQILTKHRSSAESLMEALNECEIDATNDLIMQVLKRFSNDLVPAFGFFSWAKRRTGYVHTPEVCNFMVDILGKHRKFDMMWDLVKEMANSKDFVSFTTMSRVIRRLAAAEKYEDAVEAFRGLESLGLSKNVEALGNLMDALVKGGSVELAYSAFMEFKDQIPADLHIFNILIHGYCKAGKLTEAKKTMLEMEEKYGFQPDVVTYSSLIESYCKLKDFRSVDSTLTEMEEKNCKPNVITYTIIMHSFGKAKQVNKAFEVYETMKKNGIVPDAEFYGSLIFILGTSGRVKDAWSVFDDMEKQGVERDLIAFNTMIACACRNLQEEEALKLLKRMEGENCKPNVKTYAPLLKMCCRKKRVKVLRFLLDHMAKNNVSIDLGTYALLVRGLCNSGKVELACSFFEESTSKGMVPYDSMYRILIEELERNKMAESVEKIQKLMVKMKQQKQGKPMPS